MMPCSTVINHSNLVSLCLQQNQIGIALLDLSAGIFKVQQMDYLPEQLTIELSRLMPSEIVVDEDIVDPNIIEQVKKQLDCPVTKRPNVDFNLNNAQKTLCDQFAVSSLSGFGIDHLPLAKAAAAALISLRQRNPKNGFTTYSQYSIRNKAAILLRLIL